MSVLTDLYIANPSEAEKLGLADDTFEEFTGIDIKGLDNVTMSSLYSILSQKPQIGALKMVFEASAEGPWIIVIPDNFTQLLSNLKGKDISTIVEEWGKTEEMELLGWKDKAIAQKLETIIKLASEAKKRGKGLLMWMCL